MNRFIYEKKNFGLYYTTFDNKKLCRVSDFEFGNYVWLDLSYDIVHPLQHIIKKKYQYKVTSYLHNKSNQYKTLKILYTMVLL